MYTKDKSQRITLRLNEEQFNFVKKSADMLGVSPSDFLRMVVNVSMSADKSISEKLPPVLDEVAEEAFQDMKIAAQNELASLPAKSDEEGFRRENEKTNNDNLV